ncbi:MAG: hypothetical protein ABI169_16540, partial [Chitinophagaceae bacterium]
TVAATGIAVGAGTGAFSSNLTGLDPNKTYYIRAYATNSSGTAYGNEVSFTTTAVTTCNIVNVTSNINTPTTWTAGNVYVIKNDISVFSTLTIEPGVVVKFINDNGKIQFTVGSGGVLVANGTASNHITFTSIADDSKCGDTNGDGNATAPAKGDWSRIVVKSTPGTVFRYCDVYYGGSDYYHGTVFDLTSLDNPVTIDNCVFAHNSPVSSNTSYAIYGSELSLTQSSITNNTLYDNDKPIKISDFYSLDASNTFHNPTNPSQTNKFNGIVIGSHCTFLLTRTMNIVETEVPTAFDVCGVTVTTGGTLNVGNDVVVKVFPGIEFDYDNANMINFGSNCLFTSYKDDVNGGDANGDDVATAPADGDWEGIKNTSSHTWQTANALYDSH